MRLPDPARLYARRLEMSVAGLARVRDQKSCDFYYRKNQTGGGILRRPSPVSLFSLLVAVAWSLAAVEGNAYETKPLTAEQAEEYKLDQSCYKKGTMVQEILIATSERVSDFAHQEAAYQFDMIMSSIDAKVAQRIRERKVLCLLIAHNEMTSDLPQFATDKTGEELDFYNWRNRGFLSWKGGRPTVVFSEEDVLQYEGGMQLESILIHEFGHVIHGAGFDKPLQDRLTEAFEAAKAKGLWNDGRAAQRFRRITSETPVSLFDALVKSFPDESPDLLSKCLDGGDILVNGKPAHSKVEVTKDDKVLIVFGGPKQCYAGKNRSEYWAEGVQNWYDTNRTMDHDHNHIHTRKQLKSYDPGLAELCAAVLGDADWRFVPPAQRAGTGHLAGYDPATAPKVVEPDHIKEAANDYYDEYWKDYWQRLRDKYAPCALVQQTDAAAAPRPVPVAALKTFGTSGKAVYPFTEGDKTEAELFRHEGQGCLTHMWFGGKWPDYERLRIRVYVDGEQTASIDMELFLGHGIGFKDDFGPWGTKRIGKTGQPSGIYNTYRIPFGRSVRVTAQLHEGDTENKRFWYIIRGVENLPVEFNGVRLPADARLKLYKREDYTAQTLEEVDLCNTNRPGMLYQVTIAAQGERLNFLESCVRAYVDGGKEPLLASSGLEDYFLGTYFFNRGKYHNEVAGLTHLNQDDHSFSAYRFHEEDPIFFKKGLRLTVKCGEQIEGQRHNPRSASLITASRSAGVASTWGTFLTCRTSTT